MKKMRLNGFLLLYLGLVATTFGQRATPVIAARVVATEIVDEVEALGTLRANESVIISSTVTELVEKLHFDDGDQVEKGQIIVEMDAAEEFALMVEEQTRLKQTERQLKRTLALIDSGAVSQSLVDEAQRDFDAAKARVTAIQSRIDQRILRAPFDGLTGLRMMSQGALVQPGMMITSIDDIATMKLDFSVPSVFLATLRKGIPIIATTRAFPGKQFIGTINGIDSRIDPVTRSIMVRAIIPNKEGNLRPGLLMQVTLQKNQRTAPTIPEEAITLDGSKASVWRIISTTEQGDIVRQVTVQLGARRQGLVEVLHGLAEGDLVVTHGGMRLRPEVAVRVAAIDDGSVPIKEILKTIRQTKQP